MKNLSCIALQWLVILVFTFLASCGHDAGKRQENTDDNAAAAMGLDIYRSGDCWVAEVISPTDSSQNLGVYIFPDSDNASDLPDIPGANIFPPSKRQSILLFSSVYSSVLKQLDSQQIIKAAGDVSYLTDKDLLNRLNESEVINVGTQQEPLAELIIASKPDMIIVSHFNGVDVSKLEKLGVPIIYMRESTEEEPLGRAEWIKLLGLIAGKKEKADSIFNSVSKEYNYLKKKAANVAQRPLVMTETMYDGTWFIPGGGSYAAKLIEDAGGSYIWSDDNSAGSLQQGFETVFERGSKSDIWLLKTFDEDLSLKSLETQDSRYMLFKPAQTGGVWSVNTKAMPYFDETPFHPELILKDYISIFHPSLIPGLKPHYYKQAMK
ncbi:MAG: ABC transporter substrate-binding protein [Prevotella sp.]|nr:ABC transporter substrate-binding protein [Prevotella sp.]MCM1074719.1 ABC transporter substrate-binding protein [Ruminococcus sp.]